ncbi:MAG: hypothetical protein LQ342_001336 [Letrouitia transgressa]|nr:MAG: hypothetical protein LQ342_001336 [Letrouitia transgressa]
MAKSSKRRRLNDPGNLSPISTSLSQESVLITDDDKREWKGFCEIESEPAFFNAILKDFGVRGVKTVDNACASVALLNIVNNVSSLELGDSLQQFKDFTATFTPALRGDAIGNFDHVRSIHNSFAR